MVDSAVQLVANKMGVEVTPLFSDDHMPKMYLQKMVKRSLKIKEDDLKGSGWEDLAEPLEEFQDDFPGWKEWMQYVAEKALDPEPLGAGECRICGGNEKVDFSNQKDQYWTLWDENGGSSYACDACKKQLVNFAGTANGLSWANEVANSHHHHGHVSSDQHDMWTHFHDYLKDHTGIELDEDTATNTVHRWAESVSSWFHH